MQGAGLEQHKKAAGAKEMQWRRFVLRGATACRVLVLMLCCLDKVQHCHQQQYTVHRLQGLRGMHC
jgi:hypothetical protein